LNSILITGGAGFIGSHTALRFAKLGFEVTAVDNLSTYYSVNLKKSRVQKLLKHENIRFVEGSMADEDFSA
jgi:UDP-glucuronate 4-epimerase